MSNCFAPNINLFRDPRWGRGSETFGEDPALTGQLAVAFVRWARCAGQRRSGRHPSSCSQLPAARCCCIVAALQLCTKGKVVSACFSGPPARAARAAPLPGRGLQGGHPRYLQVGATCKHLAAYSLEEWEGVTRHEFDAAIDARRVLGSSGRGQELCCCPA